MHLTREQVEAAKARGCAFFPVTEAQVAHLSMQRRIFHVGGEAFVATRDGGGLFETHGALSLLIGGQAPGRERGAGKTAHEAVAADAVAAAEIAAEQGAARSGAQVVRRGGAARPRVPSRGGKRGA